MTKEEFSNDLERLIEVSEQYEKEFLFYYEKYTKDDSLIPEIKEIRKDKEVYKLIERLEESYLRIKKNI